MSKKFKCAVLTFALASVVAASASMAACTIKTKHPNAQINISFNNKTYTIDYQLYRNMYPQTVQHFIELADNGFYNDMIVHDYKTNDWLTGGYSYNAEETSYTTSYTGNTLGEYLEKNSKEEEYYGLFNAGKLSSSVYKKLSYENGKETVLSSDALPTLIGEFSVNDHNIEKGALSANYGCLKMYYYSKGNTNQNVIIKNSFNQILSHDYKYNCATSIFAMQVSDSTSYNASNYCVFAQLKNDKAREALTALQDAISDYTATLSKFTTSVSTKVDNLDTFAEDGGREIETSFAMSSAPIIVKSVKITKY